MPSGSTTPSSASSPAARPVRFDTRDWKGSQRDAVERIELYDRFVTQTIAELRLQLAERALDRELWAQIRNEFAAQIAGLPDNEFTKTFFSSITRQLFGTVGVAPEIEFVATELTRSRTCTPLVGTNTYPNRGSLQLLIEDLLGDLRFRSAVEGPRPQRRARHRRDQRAPAASARAARRREDRSDPAHLLSVHARLRGRAGRRAAGSRCRWSSR